MSHQIRAFLIKEWKEILRQDESPWANATRLFLFAAVGVLLASFVGPSFGAGWTTVPLTAFVAGLVLLPVVPSSVAGEREEGTLETLLAGPASDRGIVVGKFLACVSYGTALAVAALAAGLVYVGLRYPDPVVVRPAVVVAALVGAALTAGAVTGVGLHVSLHAPTTRRATELLSVVFIALAVAPVLLQDLLPAELIPGGAGHLGVDTELMWAAGGQMVLLDLVLLATALARFERSRMITS